MLAAGTLALTLMVGALHASPAHARSQSSVAASEQRAHAAALEDDLATLVCSIVKRPFTKAVDGMISLLSKGRYRRTLAGALSYELGFKPWCKDNYGKLHDVLRSAARQEPSVKPKIGPFVFNARATFTQSRLFPRYDNVTVRWNAFTLSSPLRYYYVQYSLNGRPYQVVQDRSVLVDHDDVVQFAVRIDNRDGYSSPWVYSPTYRP